MNTKFRSVDLLNEFEFQDYESEDILKLISSLKVQQDLHDQIYHYDIYSKGKHQKMRHYALHISKYVGSLLTLCEHEKFDTEKRLLIDMAIICLAGLNAIDPAKFSSTSKNKIYHTKVQIDLDKIFLTSMSKLSKACEAREHLEILNYDQEYYDSLVHILRGVFWITQRKSVDIVDGIKSRWKEIESKALL